MMKSPPTLRERYLTDPAFKALTDHLEAFIGMGDYTPSEVRQAAMLACINHEYRTLRAWTVIPGELEDALRVLEKATDR